MLNSELYSYVSKFYILVPEQYIFISKGFVHIYGNPKQASTIYILVGENAAYHLLLFMELL